MLNKKRQAWIVDLYQRYGTIKAVEQVTGFNYRTIKKYLIKYGINTEPEKKTRGVKIFTPEYGETSFESISQGCAFLRRRDEEKKRKLLSKPETFEAGLNFRILNEKSYRRYIAYALRGELKQNFDWRVISENKKEQDQDR